MVDSTLKSVLVVCTVSQFMPDTIAVYGHRGSQVDQTQLDEFLCEM